MGLILDFSVVIAEERKGHAIRQILEQFKTSYGETEIGLSVVTIVVLGASRGTAAGSDAHRAGCSGQGQPDTFPLSCPGGK